MTYSYTQISQYLTCPRRYRHRYLDGWKEKDYRAAMLFGRTFEQALGVLFRRQDPGGVLFAEWSACQNQELHYSNRDSWDHMLRQLIRQHQLDPNLVKAYATDFCAVKTLRDATREQVENFVAHLSDWAEKDRNALLCQLNSYLGQKEGAA